MLLAPGCAKQPAVSNKPVPKPSAVDKYVEAVHAQRAGNTDAAISSLEDATRANPDLTMARSLLGDLYKDKGNYSKAADQYQAVTDLDPYNAHAFYKLGVAQHLMQRLADAARSYERAIRLDPRDWESHMNLGLVDLALGRKDQAISHLTEATMINPGEGAAFGNLAIALDAAGRYPDAEKAYRRALELDPEDTASLGNLGKNFMKQKKGKEALTVLQKLADMTESASARKLYADALVMNRQHDNAIKLYDGILSEDNNYYPALNGKGTALISKYEDGHGLDMRTRAAAVEAWKESLALNPNQPRVEEMLKKWQQ
jgi:tetratricopeptide (TPR) repeat protein